MDHPSFPTSPSFPLRGIPTVPPVQRQEGDRVLEVNGTQGSSIEMAKILRQAPFLKTLRGSFLNGEETAKMAALFDRSALIFWMPIFNTYVKYIVKYS